MNQLLAGKVALVTGGSRGIGAAIVQELAAQGAHVALTYSKSSAQAEALVAAITKNGGKAKAYQADAAMPQKMHSLAEAVLKDFGAIDILVNNAGIFDALGPIGMIDLESYEKVQRVNVDAVVYLTNAVVPHLKAGARIINISSVLGERAGVPGISIYNASKFAVTGLTRSWAKDLGAQGILVNAVQPGPIATEMNPDEGEQAEFMKRQTALGRYGQPHEIAAAVAFLAGPHASYITGALLNVDGGYNA
jgi:NAD(P)-dependent dehydrogenase (short-subunit alcohol dehydrogenase family)